MRYETRFTAAENMLKEALRRRGRRKSDEDQYGD